MRLVGQGPSRGFRLPLRSAPHQRQQRRGGPCHGCFHVSRVGAGVLATARQPRCGTQSPRITPPNCWAVWRLDL